MGLATKRMLSNSVRQRQENQPPIPVDPATLAAKKRKQDGPRSNGDVHVTIEPKANGSNPCNDVDGRDALAIATANDNDNPPPPIRKELLPKSLQGHCSDPRGGGYWAIDFPDRKRKRSKPIAATIVAVSSPEKKKKTKKKKFKRTKTTMRRTKSCAIPRKSKPKLPSCEGFKRNIPSTKKKKKQIDLTEQTSLNHHQHHHQHHQIPKRAPAESPRPFANRPRGNSTTTTTRSTTTTSSQTTRANDIVAMPSRKLGPFLEAVKRATDLLVSEHGPDYRMNDEEGVVILV